MGGAAIRLKTGKATRKIRISQKTKIVDVLDKLGLNREMVVVKLNGKIVAEDEGPSSGDLVEIISIVTGG